jgi:GNAT superfamily N-acetyltransferase
MSRGAITEYALISPVDARDWASYHDIRRRVLFEARGQFGVYDEHHPDERAAGHFPKLLLIRDDPVGVVGVDIVGADAWLRRVAVRSDVQRRGHGRALIALVERFARSQQCDRLRSRVAPDGVEFYRKSGFATDEQAPDRSGHQAVLMTKPL